MKRHPALVPLSHDHHHSLVEARRLRQAAGGIEAEAAANAFLRFFAAESVGHFREEEELLFPLVADRPEAREPVVRALLEHQRLHALAARLDVGSRAGRPEPELMFELGELVDAHVRYEEQELFPLLERLLDDATLETLALDHAVSQSRSGGGGPVWGIDSEDLNATLLQWGPGRGPAEHVNEERDVLVVVVEGSAAVTLDGDERLLVPGEALIVGKGQRRAVVAGPGGVRYVSVHRRRPPLQVSRITSTGAEEG